MTESGNQYYTSDLIVCSASFSQKSIELRDAKARAQSFAEKAGVILGNFKKSAMTVFQICAKFIRKSNLGSFNQSNFEK